MFRRSVRMLILSLRDVVGRLDSLEKEVIELKEFRQAVEATSPEVAVAAEVLAKERRKVLADVNAVVENPLTSEEFVELNQFYALQVERSLPLSNMMHIHSLEDLCSHAKLIHREYLVRVAQRARSLSHAPLGLSQMHSIQELRRWYEWTFHDVNTTPAPDCAKSALKFDSLIRRVFLRHCKVSNLLREGMCELVQRERWVEDLASNKSIASQLDTLESFFGVFCTERVKLRFLVGNYMYLSTRILQVESNDNGKLSIPFFYHDPDTFVGQISCKCSLTTLLKNIISYVGRLYDEVAIELRVSGDPDLTFVGIPYIMYDILLAMINDAVEANLLRQEKFGIPFTPIAITLSQRKGSEMYCVRVSDTAGGKPLDETQHILKYWYSFNRGADASRDADAWTESPIRMHYAHCAAKALGGDISVFSIEGCGTDRTLYTPSTGVERIIQQMPLTNHREMAHIRQDLAVTKEILEILKEEKDRLAAVADDRACEIARLNDELEECTRLSQDQKSAYELEVNRLKESVVSLEAELSEAFSERKRLSELLRVVRGQVDGRLTKQVGQLQQRDEMIHRLDYEKREYEREIERLNKAVKAEATKVIDLEHSQEVNSQLVSAELANLHEQVAQYKVELAAAHLRGQQEASTNIENIYTSQTREVSSMFFLYRNWLTEVSHAVNTVEDKVEDSLSKGIDSLALMTSCGLPYIPPHLERRRLSEMKKVERERIRGELTFHQDSACSYEESFAFAVYSLRKVWDLVKHSIEKVTVVSQQLVEVMTDILDASQKVHDGIPSSQSVEEPKEVVADCLDTKRQPSQIPAQSFEEDIRQKDSEITKLTLSLGGLNEQYSLLQNQLLKARENIENMSLNNSKIINEVKDGYDKALRCVEEVAEQKLEDMKDKYEKKIRYIEEEAVSLRTTSSEQNVRMETMKNSLLESKKRRLLIKEENESLKKQLHTAEDLVNSLRIELVGANRTIELLQIELQQKDVTDKNCRSSSSSQQFNAFKRELNQHSHNIKSLFLCRPS